MICRTVSQSHGSIYQDHKCVKGVILLGLLQKECHMPYNWSFESYLVDQTKLFQKGRIVTTCDGDTQHTVTISTLSKVFHCRRICIYGEIKMVGY